MLELDYIDQEGAKLKRGQTSKKLVCPWCNGGLSKDISFFVTRSENDKLLYICHRAKCGKKGVIDPSIHTSISVKNIEPSEKFVPKPYTKRLERLRDSDFGYLWAKYGIPYEYADMAQWLRPSEEPGDHPLMLPVFGPTGVIRGAVLRNKLKDGSKVSLTFKVMDEPWLCWYMNRLYTDDILIVEDQISACKAASWVTACALLGTGLNDDKIYEIISQQRSGNVWLALDKDALGKSLKLLRRWRLVCPELKILYIPKDIKDMTNVEISNLGGPFLP